MRGWRLAVVFVVAVLAHVRSLTYWFNSTDTLGLIETSRIGSLADAVDVVTTPMLSGARFSEVALFYRPVTSLSFALDYGLWGLQPWGYHLTNVLLHGLAAVLVALAVRAVTGRPLVGFLAAGLFALHPLTAEVVPAIARRQDVLMTVFLLASLTLLVRSRRRESRPLLAASVATYALAVGAKEPALVFPALVATWAALDGTDRSIRGRLRSAVVVTAPFAAVTVAALAARVVVLGGLGGYRHSEAVTLIGAGELLLKYVLSVAYPADVLGVWAVPAGWPLAVLGAAVLGLAALLWRAAGERGADGAGGVGTHTDGVAFAATVAALAGIGLLVAVGRGLDALPIILGYPRPESALVGAGYLGVGLGALAVAVSLRPRLPDADRAALALFAVWFALPLVLFLRSAEYTVRSGYFSLVPAVGAAAVLLVAGWRGIAGRVDRDGWRAAWQSTRGAVAGNAALVVAIGLLILPLLAVTPLVHAYDGWRTAGQVSEVTLETVEAEVAAAGDVETVRIDGFPVRVKTQLDRFPRVISPAYLKPGTVESWLRLRGAGDVTVVVDETVTLPTPPAAARAEATRNGAELSLGLAYQNESTAG